MLLHLVRNELLKYCKSCLSLVVYLVIPRWSVKGEFNSAEILKITLIPASYDMVML